MPPSSYQAPTVGDRESHATVSQSAETNLSSTKTTVAELLANKDGKVITVNVDDTIETVVMLLREKHIGAVLVTDESEKMVGILSERDIVRKMAETPGKTLPQQVKNLMTENVITCTPSDLLINVLHKMTDGRFRHMPVVDDHGELTGIITIGDVVHFRLNQLEYEALKMKQMIVG